MSKPLSEILLEQQADAASDYLTKTGSLQGFAEKWANDLEPAALILARKAQKEVEAAAAKTPQPKGDDDTPPANLKRSEMTTSDKVAFIGKYGQDAFERLPE